MSNAPPDVAPAESAPEETPDDAPQSKRKGHGRRRRPDHIEVPEKVYDLSDAEKAALAGDGQLVYIGDEVSEH